MSEWYTLYEPDYVKAYQISNKIQEEAFLVMAATKSKDVAVFSFQDQDAGTRFWFSPDAASIARTHGGIACPKPLRSELDRNLLCGEQTVLDRLFG